MTVLALGLGVQIVNMSLLNSGTTTKEVGCGELILKLFVATVGMRQKNCLALMGNT
ncbi:hypothetical protein PPHE_a1011 [Pseudoalteromonas phenolica O-BC30]|nr:hypothetical protein [Pseudoalteromonas phenolica O-BC30]